MMKLVVIYMMRAVEDFDVSRGFKFSTYAPCAVMRAHERETENGRPCHQEAVHGMPGRLDDRERQILVGSGGLGGACELTMAQLGEELGISRERVRQRESRAREKLRRFALEQGLDPTAARRAVGRANPRSKPASGSPFRTCQELPELTRVSAFCMGRIMNTGAVTVVVSSNPTTEWTRRRQQACVSS
jgi:DNA-binding CsgD family transcriptional regulator